MKVPDLAHSERHVGDSDLLSGASNFLGVATFTDSPHDLLHLEAPLHIIVRRFDEFD